jgi:hypothetical protein
VVPKNLQFPEYHVGRDRRDHNLTPVLSLAALPTSFYITQFDESAMNFVSRATTFNDSLTRFKRRLSLPTNF